MAKKTAEQAKPKIRFKKAKPMQKFFKCSVYGPPGSGKTYTTLLQATGLAKHCGKRIAFIDTERGTDFYTDKFDFDCIYTRSLSETLSAVKEIDTSVYGVVVIDSVTHLWQAAIDSYEGKMTSIGGIPMAGWSPIKKPFKELVQLVIDGDYHTFILGRQKNMFDTGADGSLVKVGVGMKAEGDTEYEPHVCARMEANKNPNDTTISTYHAIYEKDRTGLLAGKTFNNPSFKTIECVLPLLTSDEQAKSEDIEEVIAKDSELAHESQEKKIKSSHEILDACSKLIAEAKDLKSFAEAKEQCMTKRRYLTHDDLEVLRSTYTEKQKKLVA